MDAETTVAAEERGPAAALDPDLAARLEALIDRRATRHTGLAAGVLMGGRAAYYVRGRGHRDRPQPPAADTLFEIGSITKTFTATLLALMAAAGEVALDDPVQQYLPTGVTLPVRGRPVTLVDLATQSSGLPASHPGMLRHWWRHRADPYADITFDDFYAAVGRTKPRAASGEKWCYSNFGFALLGNALAARAGLSYEELVRLRVCRPLALVDTVATVDGERAGRFAQGHDRRGRPVSHWELPALAGAGALRSTVADMLAYLGAELTAGEAGDASGEIGRQRLRVAMKTTQELRFRRHRMAMGLGWILLPQKGRPHPIVFHNGGTGGFRSFAGFVPQTQTAAVVLVNDSRSPDRLGMELSGALQDAAPADPAQPVVRDA